MNVSETVTFVFERGILTEKRELMPTVMKARRRNCKPMLDHDIRIAAVTVTTAPRRIIDHR
jgi:hypothetical protein